MVTNKQKVSFTGLLDVTALFLFVFSAASFLGGSLFFELVSHFQLQYLGASLFLSGLFVVIKHLTFLPFTLLSAVLSAYQVVPFYLSNPQKSVPESANEITLLLSNVLTTNKQYDRLLTLIEHEAPDIIVLLEINDTWRTHLESLSNHYPYQTLEPRQDNFGIALLSRHPPVKSEIIRMAELTLPSIEASYQLGQTRFHILATHPFHKTMDHWKTGQI